MQADGTLIEGAALENYTFTWTNNLTADVYTGTEFGFPLESIDHVDFTVADDLIFYLTVTETATGHPVAFRIREFQLHPESVPEIDYSVSSNGLQLDIQDVTLNGTAHTITWNFGDGISVVQTDPGPHTYTAEGSYTITTTMQYGNKCTVTQSQVVNVDSTVFRLHQQASELRVFPNPAHDQVTLELPSEDEPVKATLYNIQGASLCTWTIAARDTQPTLTLPDLPAGTYLLRVTGDHMHASEVLVIQ